MEIDRGVSEEDLMTVLANVPHDGSQILQSVLLRDAGFEDDQEETLKAALDTLLERGLIENVGPLMFVWRRTAEGIEMGEYPGEEKDHD